MAGTSEGGKRAAETIKQKDKNFFAEIGHLGGKAGGGKGGFVTMTPEERRSAGAKGGSRPKSEETRAKMRAGHAKRKAALLAQLREGEPKSEV
jgi:general stress protein YciG